MDLKKLFHVLVVGGALASVGCGDEEAPPEDGTQQGTSPGVDAAGAATDAGAASADASGEELIDCGFCPSEMCCVTDADGNSTTKAGFECCWSTSC